MRSQGRPDQTGSSSLRDGKTGGKKAALRRVSFRATDEQVDEEFPLLLSTERTLCQFNAGTMTMRTPDTALRPTDVLEISPEDAGTFELHDGEMARVVSRYGSVSLPVQITAAVRRGELFATFHDPTVFLNRVTSPHRDRHVKSPENKVTAVRVEKPRI